MNAHTANDQELYNASIGELIARLRAENKLTMSEVALRVGTTKQSISLYERGTKTPYIWTLKRIAEAHGLSLIAFMSRVEKSFQEKRMVKQ